MFALPSYFLNDISVIEERLNSMSFPTDYLIPDLETVKVYWDGDIEKVCGEFRADPRTGRYTFYVTPETLDGVTEGEQG